MKVLVSLAIIAIIAVYYVEASPRFHGGRRGKHGVRHDQDHKRFGRNRCDLRNTTLNDVKEVVITKIDRIVTKNTNLTDSGNVITEAIRNGSLDTVILHQINGTNFTDIENEADMGNADTPVQEEDSVDTDIGEDTSSISSSSNSDVRNDEAGGADDNTETSVISKGRKDKQCCFFKLLKAFSNVDGEIGAASQQILDSLKSKDSWGHRGGGRHRGRRHRQRRGHRQAAAHYHQQSHRYSRRNEPEADQEGNQNAENTEPASP